MLSQLTNCAASNQLMLVAGLFGAARVFGDAEAAERVGLVDHLLGDFVLADPITYGTDPAIRIPRPYPPRLPGLPIVTKSILKVFAPLPNVSPRATPTDAKHETAKTTNSESFIRRIRVAGIP